MAYDIVFCISNKVKIYFDVKFKKEWKQNLGDNAHLRDYIII